MARLNMITGFIPVLLGIVEHSVLTDLGRCPYSARRGYVPCLGNQDSDATLEDCLRNQA